MVQVIKLGQPIPKKNFFSRNVTPQGKFLGKLVTGKATKQEKTKQAKNLIKGASIVGGGVAAILSPGTLLARASLGLGIPTLTGILVESKKARTFLSPLKAAERGEEIGKIIENPSSLFPKEGESITSKAKDFFGKAGKIAGAAALVAGAAVAAKKALTKAKTITMPKMPNFSAKPNNVAPSLQLIPANLPQAKPKAPEAAKADVIQSPKPIKISVKQNVEVNQKVFKRHTRVFNYVKKKRRTKRKACK